ncbi:MAG: LpxI family protein [Planctomycetes bacterium]|nr:LpxI family protein [Planctomycetota bacterium]
MSKIGLIAGNGKFPILFAQSAKRRGLDVVAIALRGETLPEIVEHADRVYWAGIAQLGKWIKLLKRENVTQAVMAGGITKAKMYSPLRILRFRPDLRTLRFWYHTLRDKKDYSLLEGAANEFAADGITICNSIEYMTEHLAEEGCCTKRRPTESEMADVRFGWDLAKQMAHLQVGQTVVVKEQAVLAVEAIEGTDAAIRRGGQLGKSGAVVVKVSKPNQDLRFDVPAIGLRTIEVLKETRARVLAVEADKTLILEKEEVIKAADRAGICILALKDK